MDSSTDSERRVTSWEHEAKETLSDLIKFGVVIRGLEKGGCRDHLLINTAGTTEMTKFVKEIGNVEITQRNTHTHSLFRWQSRPKVPRKLFMVWNLRPHGERLSKEN